MENTIENNQMSDIEIRDSYTDSIKIQGKINKNSLHCDENNEQMNY
jgi:hypothetical protein